MGGLRHDDDSDEEEGVDEDEDDEDENLDQDDEDEESDHNFWGGEDAEEELEEVDIFSLTAVSLWLGRYLTDHWYELRPASV